MGEPPEERRTEINVFRIEHQYLFKYYFDEEPIFSNLKYFYNNHQYRFEIPRNKFTKIKSLLLEYGYLLVIIDDIDEYVVAVEKYTQHPENIFKESIIHRSKDGYNCFLMKNQAAVKEAVANNGRHLQQTNIDNPFS